MILFVHQNLAYLLCHGKLANRLALSHSVAIISDGLILVVQIKTQHLLQAQCPLWVQEFINAAGGLSNRALAGRHMRTCGKPLRWGMFVLWPKTNPI